MFTLYSCDSEITLKIRFFHVFVISKILNFFLIVVKKDAAKISYSFEGQTR